MPVNEKEETVTTATLFQRQLYEKGGLSKKYWDYRDYCILNGITRNDNYIIDLGCGEGITTEKIVRQHNNCVGYDIIKENVTICREHNIPIIFGDISTLAIKSNSVDTVLLIEVIEHLKTPEDVIHEVFRILKKGGKIIIVYPNDVMMKIIRLLTGKWNEAFYDAGHLHQWYPQEVKKLLEKNDFEVIENFSIPFHLFRISLHGIVIAEKK